MGPYSTFKSSPTDLYNEPLHVAGIEQGVDRNADELQTNTKGGINMWVEFVQLDNIKCFDTLKMKFGTQKERYPWVTLLGENGSGKSTILQAMALLLAGPEGAIQLFSSPKGWVRQPNKPGKITVRLHQDEIDPGIYGGEKMERKAFQYTFYVTGSTKLTINNKVFTEPVITEASSPALTWLREHALLPKGKGWFGAGYGAFRRLTRESRIVIPALQEPLRYSNFSSQFDEDKPLAAFELWMLFLDYKIAKDGDPLAQKHHDLAVSVINALLPEGTQFDRIDSNGQIWFRTGKDQVPTTMLSDGFRSILALGGDLVWRLIEAFPGSDDPLRESGVVLIDELDIHLHPTWQRNIVSLLRGTFPSLQFIMATHSPIIAAGAGKDAITYRCYIREGAVHVEQIKNVHTQSVDQILRSEAFGLVSPFSEETQRSIDRYYALKRKSRLNETEQEELQMTFPIVEQAIGYDSSETEEQLNQYIKENWHD